MSTFSAKPAEVQHEWFVIDATDKVLGRVASEVALRLRGKHKAIYTPHVDTGDFIVIINAAQLKVTGTKSLDKVYYRHSGYPGGITATNFRDMQSKHPGRALEKAVKGMLPCSMRSSAARMGCTPARQATVCSGSGLIC